MTPTDLGQLPLVGPTPDACWRHIGVGGDRSCPQLHSAVHCRNCPVFAAGSHALFEREPPPDYLDQWTRQLADRDHSAGGDTRSLLVFRVGAEWLAFDARAVVEVVEPRRIHRVPHRTDRILLGLANIRGELYLCVSLRNLLDIEATGDDGRTDRGTDSPSAQPLVVAEVEQVRWAFPVDEIDGVHRVPVSTFENLPETLEKSARFFSQAIVPCVTRLQDRQLLPPSQRPADATALPRSRGQTRSVSLLSETRLFQLLQRAVR